MSDCKDMAEFAATINVKIAVVQVRRGESNQEAWTRHVRDHPHDANAMVKVFNQPRKMWRTMGTDMPGGGVPRRSSGTQTT